MIAVIFTTLLLAQLGDFKATAGQPRSLEGNGQTYFFKENNSPLVMTGNDCSLTIEKNTASVLVTGNDNLVKINNNSGSVQYTGNDGKIRFGSQSSQQNVDYIGDNGSVQVVSAIEPAGPLTRDSPQQFIGNSQCFWLPTNGVSSQVIGNDNTLKIQNNSGSVNCIGNNNLVILGSESSVNYVNFIGSGNQQQVAENVGSC